MLNYIKIKLIAIFRWFKPSPVISAHYNYNKSIMTIKREDGTISQYVGSYTVWHEFPYMKKCETYMDDWLYDFWKYNRMI
jgi:hypothetical protein